MDDGTQVAVSMLDPKTISLIIWAVISVFLSLYAVIDLAYRLQLFLTKRQFELVWFKYIEYILLFLCLKVLLQMKSIFFDFDGYSFTLPMNEEDFLIQLDLAAKIKNVHSDSGLVLILLMTKNLKALTSNFPALGVLFETISAARMDLLYFNIITLVLACGAAMIAYCIFGENSSFFDTIQSSFVSVIRMIFGYDMFSEFDGQNPSAALPFFLVFAILFYFVILNVYAAIVIRTYDNLRQNKQLLTEALADIFEKQALEHTETFWNIIFCRIPQRQNEEVDSSESDDEEWE